MSNHNLGLMNDKSHTYLHPATGGGGRVVQRCWVNFQYRGVLLIWSRVGQGPIALAVGVGGGCLDIFSLVYPFSFLSPFLWETARYRLKYCLKGPLSQKTTNQPILQLALSPPWIFLFVTCLFFLTFTGLYVKTNMEAIISYCDGKYKLFS